MTKTAPKRARYLAGPLKSKIDKLWLEFFAGGITNPLTVIEQISFLMFARLLDVQETRREKMAAKTGKNGSQRAFASGLDHTRTDEEALAPEGAVLHALWRRQFAITSKD
jgi:hypothetical protein